MTGRVGWKEEEWELPLRVLRVSFCEARASERVIVAAEVRVAKATGRRVWKSILPEEEL